MTEILTLDEVRHCCQRHLMETNPDNLQIISFEINEIDGTPSGFLGRHRFLTVHLKHQLLNNSNNEINNQQHDLKLKFFLKTSPDHKMAAQMEYLNEFGVFKKEVAVYKYIIPRLENININCEPFASKCYLAKENLLIFENLLEQGFRMAATRDGILSYQHLQCILKTLANIHSASLIIESRTGNNDLKFNQIYKNMLNENSYPISTVNNNNMNSVRVIYFKKACNAITNLIKLIPKYQNSSRIDEILMEFPKRLQLIFPLCQTSNKYRNTFSHGDLWANNVMFNNSGSVSTDSTNSNSESESESEQSMELECRLVDFQLSRYAPPILDVITILTITTSSEFRQKYLTELFNSYWLNLTEFLNQHNYLIEDFITKSEFDESIQEYKIAGLIESCLFSHLTLLPEDLTSKLLKNSNDFDNFLNYQRNELCAQAFETDLLYRERLTDMMSDLIDNYILTQ